MFSSSGARRVMSAAVLCLLLAACSGASSTPGQRAPAQPPDHHADWERELPPRAPYRDVEFTDAGVNPFVEADRDPLSTFAMDVDTASYSVGRRFIEDGYLPERDSVRLEEYVNSFDYGYEPPREGVFAIHVDGGPTPFTSARSVLLRIGLQSMVVAQADRQPASLTFVIDTSGSMDMERRLELVKQALTTLVNGLNANDSVAIVQFSTNASIVLRPTSAAEPEQILDAISRLTPDGSTNAQAGLELGYDMAVLARREGAINRVILASDGVANTGLTDPDSILRRIDREVESGIDLVTVGVGMGNFNDTLLESLADRGNGFYAYVNDLREAEEMFGEGLTSTLQTVARDARVQVEFRPEAVARYRLLGYENRDMADDDFRDPTVDAGEVGAGHSVTALYEIELGSPEDAFLGTVRLRWLDADSGAEEQLSRDIELHDLSRDFASTTASFRLAATVAGFAEILRESPHVGGYDLRDVAHEADLLKDDFDGRGDFEEFRRLADLAARIGRD
jgi:Ca-activated chloride channel family protein